MKTTNSLIKKLIRLSKGETLPSSELKGDLFEQMRTDGILVAITRGSRKSFRAIDEESFNTYIKSHLDIRELDDYYMLISQDEINRAEQVKIAGNSKIKRQRTFYGFMVNCYEPIHAMLAGKTLTLLPQEGTFVFIYDFKTFSVPEDVVIIGIENAENFRHIRWQKEFFKSCLPQAKLLFVSRYPQEQSHDLMNWLLTIPNKYIHFGDLDLAGIHIYLSEYYQYLGERASFLLPDDYEKRISEGNRERYERQYSRFGKMEINDHRLDNLINCIHKYHRGSDQEGFII